MGVIFCLMFLLNGCTQVKKMVGFPTTEEDDSIPPEAEEETVMVDGKPYVRSRNPYWLTYPNQPEYIYTEKGKQFEGMQSTLMKSMARYLQKDQKKGSIPPEKLQELVKQEVERIMREQGLGGVMFAKGKGETGPYPGRAVAVIPALSETPRSYEGLNLTLANLLRAELKRQKDFMVIDESPVKEVMAKSVTTGKLATRRNLQALGDALGVQGVIITQIVPPAKDSTGFMVMELYDTFMGSQVKSVLEPAGSGGLNMDAVTNAVRRDSPLLANELRGMEWFGRIEFIKEGKAYLSLGQNTGLKVGDRLKVVTPGKEVVNPTTHASLGFTADVMEGELKVTDIVGTNAAAASITSGGPFKPNEKVKSTK
jgi:hypothetical protein